MTVAAVIWDSSEPRFAQRSSARVLVSLALLQLLRSAPCAPARSLSELSRCLQRELPHAEMNSAAQSCSCDFWIFPDRDQRVIEILNSATWSSKRRTRGPGPPAPAPCSQPSPLPTAANLSSGDHGVPYLQEQEPPDPTDVGSDAK